MGNVLIVGRKTFESFKKPLEGRVLIVVSRSLEADLNSGDFDNIKAREMNVYAAVRTLQEALDLIANHEREDTDPAEGTLAYRLKVADKIYIAGGTRLYKEAWDVADKLDFTLVVNRKNVSYDTWLIDFEVKNWSLEYTPIKVFNSLPQDGVSHVLYKARRVPPGTKKTHPAMRDLHWVFDHVVGHRHIDNDVDEANVAQEDRWLAQALHAPRFPPASVKEIAEALADGLANTPDEEGEREYFNVWTRGMASDALGILRSAAVPVVQDLTAEEILKLVAATDEKGNPVTLYEVMATSHPNSDIQLSFEDIDKAAELLLKSFKEAGYSRITPIPEHQVLVDANGAVRHVTTHESSFDKSGRSGSIVVTEVGQALNRDVYQESLDRSAEHVGENLIANTRTRMTDAATEELLANHKPVQLWPHPKWTVFCTVPYNAHMKTIWKFYSDEEDAKKEYDRFKAEGGHPTKRPYFHLHDRVHCPPNWKELMDGAVDNTNGPTSPSKGS